jgi:Tat protein translocase TatB subunit
MFGIGAPELILIIVVALIFLGPEKLPETARTIGKTYRDFKRSLDELKGEFDTSINEVKKEAFKITEDDSIQQVKRDMASADKNFTDLLKGENSSPSPPEHPEVAGKKVPH